MKTHLSELFCVPIKGNVNVEVALRDINKPIGIAEYKLPIPIDEIKEIITHEIELIL